MKEKFNKIKGKLFTTLYAIGSFCYSLPMRVSADNWTEATTDAAGIVSKVLGVFTTLIAFMGAFFLAVGGFKLFMAWKGNNPEEMNGAVKEVVGGICLLAFGTLFLPILEGIGIV